MRVDWRVFGKKIVLFSIISIAIVILFNYVQVNFFGKFLILLGINATFLLALKQLKIKTLITNAVFILIFMLLYQSLGLVAGLVGWFIADIILGIAIIVLRWKSFIKLKQDTEASLWGKPLKEFREQGKKPPKIKVQWRGQKQ